MSTTNVEPHGRLNLYRINQQELIFWSGKIIYSRYLMSFYLDLLVNSVITAQWGIKVLVLQYAP